MNVTIAISWLHNVFTSYHTINNIELNLTVILDTVNVSPVITRDTITIVLISPNMKEAGKWQRSQRIPWEISYSLRETTRNDRTSHNNAILAVILPNKNGNYDYYDKSDLFPILKDNIDNGYIYVVIWDDFVKYPNADIKQAFDYREKTPTYIIKKLL